MRVDVSPWQHRLRLDSPHPDAGDVFETIPGVSYMEKLATYHAPASPYAIHRLVNHPDLDVHIDDELAHLSMACDFLEWKAENKELTESEKDFIRGQCQLKTSPWDHQLEAFNFIEGKECSYLAMDMGTGKTLVTIWDILDTESKNILILCPKSVIPVWPNEIAKHAPHFKHIPAVLTKGTGPKKCETAKMALAVAQATKRAYVLVVNYESAWRKPLADFILRQKWDYVVFDEIQKIQAAGGKASYFCKKLPSRSRKRLGLSGTPFPQYPKSIYGQARALDPGIFGTTKVGFGNRYMEMEVYNKHVLKQVRNEKELKEILNMLMFRVDREVLDLPPVTHQYRMVQLSTKARKMYDQFWADFVAAIGTDEFITAKNVLARIVRSQQITSGTVFPTDADGLKLPPQVIDKSKADALKEVISEIDPSEKIVVFCRFVHELKTLEETSVKLGRKYAELSGSRKELDGDSFPANRDVLGVQIQSGGIGVNLTLARYGIYFSLSQSLADFLQSEARIDRGGQSRNMHFIHILAEGTIDEIIYQGLLAKKEPVDAVLEYVKGGNNGI